MNKFMRRPLPAFFLMLALIWFSGCGAGSPSDNAKVFLEYYFSGDFNSAKKYCTDDSQQLLDMMSKIGKVPNGGVIPEVDIVSEEVDGDKATVKYKVLGVGLEDELTMRKVDGEWLVVFDKTSPPGAGGASDLVKDRNIDLEKELEGVKGKVDQLMQDEKLQQLIKSQEKNLDQLKKTLEEQVESGN